MSKLLKKLIFAVYILVFLSSCSSIILSSIHIRIPKGYRGEIFICEGPNVGRDIDGEFVTVDESGLGFVQSLKNFEGRRPDRVLAVDSVGTVYKNSVVGGDETVSLWPICYVEGHFFYFIIGSFDEKTVLENKRMESGYFDVIERVKSVRAARGD